MTSQDDPLVAAPGARPSAEQVDELAARVQGLRDAAATLTRRTHRNEWTIALTVIGLVLDVALSVVVFVLLSNQSVNAQRLDGLVKQNGDLITQLQVEEGRQALTAHEFCGLITLFITSDTPQARAANPAGPEKYDAAFKQIRASAERLNCAT